MDFFFFAGKKVFLITIPWKDAKIMHRWLLSFVSACGLFSPHADNHLSVHFSPSNLGVHATNDKFDVTLRAIIVHSLEQNPFRHRILLRAPPARWWCEVLAHRVAFVTTRKCGYLQFHVSCFQLVFIIRCQLFQTRTENVWTELKTWTTGVLTMTTLGGLFKGCVDSLRIQGCVWILWLCWCWIEPMVP